MRYRATISLHNAKGRSIGFGRGIVSLLKGVREYGSLHHAAKDMGMAYSKAWRILKDAEEEFGVRLLDRDGAHGSTLTAECEELIAHYEEMLAAADKAAAEIFEKYYK